MKGTPKTYSEAELCFIKSNCTLSREKLHSLFIAEFNRTDISKNNISSLCKRNAWLTGRTGCFKKGNIPHPNARPKGPNKTSFKKGDRPHNWKPVGSTRITVDGYVEVKTKEPNVWQQQHVLNWMSIHGEAPAGFCVSVIDGDKTNTEVENLELISRNENLQTNMLRPSSYPKETKPTIKVLGKLIAKTLEREKHGN